MKDCKCGYFSFQIVLFWRVIYFPLFVLSNVLQESNSAGMKQLLYMLSALSKLDIDVRKVDLK
jgi:hypothetical protein